MFGEKEFEIALQAYKRETSPKGRDEFTSLRKNNNFFEDITEKEHVEQQVRLFIDLISRMNRDSYSNRYVIQSFIFEFCRYLDKEFLFSIKNAATFFDVKEKLKEFTGEIYDTYKKFTQNVALNSLEHLLEDYGSLLKFANLDQAESYTKKSEESGGFWSGNKLW